jgi:predicted PurR-regulated permease PerM
MTSDREFTRRTIQAVVIVTAVAITVAALWVAREALLLIYVSALIAMGFAPIVQIIQRPKTGSGRRIPRAFAILVIYLTIIAVVVLLGLMVVPPLIDQATRLWSDLPRYFDRFQTFLINYKILTHRVTIQEAVQNAPVGTGGNAVETVMVAVWGLIGGVFGVITILILSFYFLVEAESLFHYVTRFVPEPQRAKFKVASREAVMKVSAWLRAQLILAGVMGVFSAVGLGLMGEPYFYVVALIAAVGETIPIIGPIIGGITAVAVAITQSPALALKVGVYFLILHQLEANILVPKIMERRVGVSPVTVMIALLIGGAILGLIGAILAIPTAAILSVAVEELTTTREAQMVRGE